MPAAPSGREVSGSGRSGRVTRLEETWIRGSKFVRPDSTLPSRKKRSHVVRRRGEDAADPKRDLRLHALLKKASGSKPMGLRTFASTQSLRRPPRAPGPGNAPAQSAQGQNRGSPPLALRRR